MFSLKLSTINTPLTKIGQSLSTLHVSSEAFHHQQAFIKTGQSRSTLHVSPEAFHHQHTFIKIGQSLSTLHVSSEAFHDQRWKVSEETCRVESDLRLNKLKRWADMMKKFLFSRTESGTDGIQEYLYALWGTVPCLFWGLVIRYQSLSVHSTLTEALQPKIIDGHVPEQ